MPQPYRIRTGDTWPPLTLWLTERCDETDEGAFLNPDADDYGWIRTVDLTDADAVTVVLKRTRPSADRLITGAATNVEALDGPGAAAPQYGNAPINRGKVVYQWVADDTADDNAGDYLGEVEVTWDAGPPLKVETFPVDPARMFPLVMARDTN